MSMRQPQFPDYRPQGSRSARHRLVRRPDGNGACLSSREIVPAGYVAVLRGDGLGSTAAADRRERPTRTTTSTRTSGRELSGGDNQLAIWRDGVLIIFKGVHRDSATGEADTVAFALPD
jgi:hypothetical protein